MAEAIGKMRATSAWKLALPLRTFFGPSTPIFAIFQRSNVVICSRNTSKNGATLFMEKNKHSALISKMITHKNDHLNI